MTTLAKLSAQLASGELSSVELTQMYLDRIEQSNHNAFISTNSDLALAAAKAADKRRADGDTNPLLGLSLIHI